MKTTSRRVRQLSFAVLVLVAVGHANLAADLTGRSPNASGMTRLGRDLLRKSLGEPCVREALSAPRWREKAGRYMKPQPSQPRHILTETAVGYRLVQQPRS